MAPTLIVVEMRHHANGLCKRGDVKVQKIFENAFFIRQNETKDSETKDSFSLP